MIEERSAGIQYQATFRIGLNEVALRDVQGTPSTLQSYQQYNDNALIRSGRYAPAAPSRSYNAPVREKSLGWVLLIPVHRSEAGPIVWKPENQWISEWAIPAQRRATDFIVTGGDVDDKRILSDAEAAMADPYALQRLAEKYQANGTALVTLDTAFSENPETGGVVEVSLWTQARGLMTLRAPVQGNPVYAEARSVALTLLDNLAEGGNVFQPALSGSGYAMGRPAFEEKTYIEVPIKANLRTPSRWMEIRYSLSTIPGLIIKPIKVTNTQAEMIVRYPGTRESLLQELRERGLAR